MLTIDREAGRVRVCADCRGTCGVEFKVCPRCGGALTAITPPPLSTLDPPTEIRL